MSCLFKLVDEIWPTIDSEGQKKAATPSTAHLDRLQDRWSSEPDDNVEVLLSELRLLSNEENDRRSRVEAKAASMLAAISLSVTLGSGFLFAVVSAEFSSANSKTAALVAFALVFLSLVYLTTAAWHALGALKRTEYSTLGPEDLMSDDCQNASQLQRRIASAYEANAIANREPTNRKVDSVHLAQCCVRNAVVTVVLVVVASFFVALFAPVRGSTNVAACVCSSPTSAAQPTISGLSTSAVGEPPSSAAANVTRDVLPSSMAGTEDSTVGPGMPAQH